MILRTYKDMLLVDNAPDFAEHCNGYKDDEIYVDNDDIGYYYVNQDGGETGWFYSIKDDEFKRY